MKKLLLTLLSFITIVACSNSSPNSKNANEDVSINKYDNSSYYDSEYHSLAESDMGYYTLINNLLVFVDKETNEMFLVSREKNSLEDLLADDNKRENSDAYFPNAREVFYEAGNIYLVGDEGLAVVSEENYARTMYDELFIYPVNIYKGSLYYIKAELDPSKENKFILKKYHIAKKEDQELLSLKYEIEKLGYTNLAPQKTYIYDDNLYMYMLLDNDDDMEHKLAKIDLTSNEIDFIDEKIDGYELSNFYISDGKLICLYAARAETDESAWSKIPGFALSDGDKKEIPLLKTLVYSDNDVIESSFSALSAYKAYDIKDDGLIETPFTINQDEKELTLPESFFKLGSEFTVKLNNQGDVLLSYTNGDLILIKDGSFIEVFTEPILVE